MKRTVWTAMIVIGIAALVVAGMVRFWPHVPLDAALTDPKAPPARLVCSGYVDCRHGLMQLLPTRPGRVVRVLIKENQTVSKDMPLIQLDDDLVRLQEQEAALGVEAAQLHLTKAQEGVKQYQAKRAQAEAAIQAAHARSSALEHALAIEQGYFEQKASSKNRVDAARAQLESANALVVVEQNKLAELQAIDPETDVNLAQTQLSRSKSQLERARRERAEYVLCAPVSGLVLRVLSQEGDPVSPTSARPAVWLSPEGPWIVRAEVSQEFAGKVHEGLPVQIEDEANTTMLANGKVSQLSDWFLPRRQSSLLPTSINTGQTLECVIELESVQSQLRLGQRVRVRILADGPSVASLTTRTAG